MKNFLLFFLIQYTSLFASGLDLAPMNYYHVKTKGSKQIHFDNQALTNADYESFKTLLPSDNFARDKNNLYFKGHKITGLDRKNFKAYSNYLGSDGSNLILLNSTKNPPFEKISKKAFQKLSSHFFKDDSNIYFLRIKNTNNGPMTKTVLQKVKGAKSREFRILFEEDRPIDDPGTIIGRDNNNIYLGGKAVLKIDPKSEVRIIKRNPAFGVYLVIGKQLHYFNKVNHIQVKKAVPKHLKFINDAFLSDGISLFKAGQRVPLKYKASQTIKANSLNIIEEVWGIHKDSVFYLGNSKIEEFTGVNTISFKILRNYCKHGIGCIHLAKDTKSYFYGPKKYAIKPLDPTMKYVLEKLPDLRRAVFYPGTGIQVKEADPETFKVFKEGYAKDHKNFFYYGQKIVPKVNAKTFRVIGYGFAKDAQRVYVNGQWIKQADAKTFKRVPPKFGLLSHSSEKIWSDKNYRFDQNGKIVN